MNFKIPLYITLFTTTLILEIVWLAVLVCLVTFADMILGVWLVYKLKEQSFNFLRFLEGFGKMIFYAFCIGITYLISIKIFDGKMFDIVHLLPKVATMLFITIEAISIDKKSVRLGNKPILEIIRGVVKTFKELYKSFSSITKIPENNK